MLPNQQVLVVLASETSTGEEWLWGMVNLPSHHIILT